MEDPRSSKNQFKQLPLQFNKTVWIQTQSTNEHSHKKSAQLSDQFKKQHQLYLASKMKRRYQQRIQKIQNFGDSSSSEDQLPTPQLFPIKSQTNQPQIDLRLSKKPESSISVKSPEKRKNRTSNINLGSGKKQEKEDRLDILVNSKKGVDVWLQDKVTLTEKVVVLPHCQYPYYDISKLKLIFSSIGDRCFKIKISCKNEEFIFGASSIKHSKQVPPVFYIFAKIIKFKLELMGKKLIQNLELSSANIPQALLKNSTIYGRLLKKSRVLGRWSEIFGVINRQGLVYYKKITDKPNLLVPRGTITQLWSRFEFHEEWFIIKLFQGSHKIELGIPIFDQITAKAWLFQIYNLIFKI